MATTIISPPCPLRAHSMHGPCHQKRARGPYAGWADRAEWAPIRPDRPRPVEGEVGLASLLLVQAQRSEGCTRHRGARPGRPLRLRAVMLHDPIDPLASDRSFFQALLAADAEALGAV